MIATALFRSYLISCVHMGDSLYKTDPYSSLL
jgi:hypothetical protein